MSSPRTLLEWYDARGRRLPWRETRDPYRIWVSEIMLQQTQVRTVIPYYAAFLQRFPSVEDLAMASVEEVLAVWSGLGYYRRARQLHQAAKRIVSSGSGFPSSSRQLLELPGVGPYTAAAVASIAFGEIVPVLDGNVERVLCRRLGCDQDPKRRSTRRKLVEAASRLLDPARPGDSNQALMELGATVCRPKRPDCDSCPLRRGCRGLRSGDPERYPPPRRRRAVERVELVVAVARQRQRVLVFRRPEGTDRLAGMWELPNVPRAGPITSVEDALARRYGGLWQLEAESRLVRHGITYTALRLHVHPARFNAGDMIAEGPEAAWVTAEELSGLPTSSMVGKVLSR